MTTKYEYIVVTENGPSYKCFTRQEARDEKKYWKESNINAKIIQKRFVLEAVKEVR